VGLVLRPYQADLVDRTEQQWRAGARTVLMRLATGGGKCLAPGTPVIMANGETWPVERVRQGDRLLAPGGGSRLVLGTCTGREAMYRVTPTKGDAFVCNESHILSLQRTQKRKGDPVSAPINISVREYLTKNPTWKHLHKGYRAAVDFPEQNLNSALPPYLLGVWLGDGDSNGPVVTTTDGEVLGEVMQWAECCGLKMRVEQDKRRPSLMRLHLTKGANLKGSFRYGQNPVRNALKANNLINNKHVPLSYKTASRTQRLDLLAGLMDTDGYKHHEGFDYISVRKTLAEDVAWLCRSVGLAAYVKDAWKSCNGGRKALYYRVSISGDCSIIPCRIARKRAAVREQIKHVLRFGFTVEPIGEGAYCGFELDGDGLFLLGDFTVTHNTVCFADIIQRHNGASCMIVHRTELVTQISLTLARLGIRHDVFAAEQTRRAIARLHVDELGTCYYQPGARCVVASVDTLVRMTGVESWAAQVTLWICDEGHHALDGNKWGKVISLFQHPQCRGLLPTATPIRADGKGLGRLQSDGSPGDGFADVMVEGPPERWLIDEGYLTDYRVVCPPSDLQIAGLPGASGDWSPAQLKAAARASHITGDLPRSYMEFTPYALGISFCTDVETAIDTCEAYRALGVRAETITGETHPAVRRDVFRRFERQLAIPPEQREITQLCVVDIVSEGTDLPVCQVGSFGRPSEALGLVRQQMGRIFRPVYAPGPDLTTTQGRLEAIALSDKPYAWLIDHVRHFVKPNIGPPDRPRVWTLDRRDKRGKSAPDDAIPLRVCIGCYQPYERFYRACPFCGHEPVPASRGGPEFVDGDLALLDDATLAALRGAVVDVTPAGLAKAASAWAATGLPQAFVASNGRAYNRKIEAQVALRAAMAQWGGREHAAGRDDAQIQRLFYLRFGLDVLSAQGLAATEANVLHEKVLTDLSAPAKQ
jgi:superfamily II DNA or RNA helicase